MRLLWKLILRIWIWYSTKLTLLAMHLVKLTHKSSCVIHPKHLINNPHHHWYLEFINTSDRVLDMGCDTGSHSFKVAKRAALVVAFDYRLSCLQTARQRHLESAMNTDSIFFLSADAEKRLPFRAMSFDKVLILDVIEHLHHRTDLLREIVRILRPNGLAIISAPNRNTRWKQILRSAGLPWMDDADHKIEYTLPELIDEITNGGFSVVGKPMPTVLSTPLQGIFDLVGGINLSLFFCLQRWKINMAQTYPYEATGWRIVCRKITE